MTKNMHFKNQVAIITGGSSGIGEGIATGLAKEGAKVYILARKENKLQEAASRITSIGGKVEYRITDITKDGEIEKIVADIYSQEKRLDIFVNNAGDYIPMTISTNSAEKRKLFDLLFHAPARIAEHLALNYKDIKILNTLSHASIRNLPGNIVYAPGKAALMAHLIQLDMELLEHKINTSNDEKVKIYRLYPGAIATGNFANVADDDNSGKYEKKAPLEAVVDLSLRLLKDETPTRDAFVGFKKGHVINGFYDVSQGDYDTPGHLVYRKDYEKLIE